MTPSSRTNAMSCSTTTTVWSAVDLLEQLGGLLGLGVGHAGDRLVDQQQLRVLREQHADLEPLLLAVRQAAGEAVAHARRGGWCRASRRCGCARSAVVAPEQSARARVRSPFSASSRLSSTVWLSNTVGFWNLRPMPSSAICGLVELGAGRCCAVEQHVAGVGPGLAGDDVHHRGLAGAVGADDGAHLAGLDRERQIVERAEAVERDA